MISNALLQGGGDACQLEQSWKEACASLANGNVEGGMRGKLTAFEQQACFWLMGVC